MAIHEVTILEPGIRETSPSNLAWESQYATDVYITPRVNIGPQLESFIGGAVGIISVAEVASSSEGTHATVACGPDGNSYSHGSKIVEQAVNRLRTYFGTEPSQLGVLRQSYAQEPLSKITAS